MSETRRRNALRGWLIGASLGGSLLVLFVFRQPALAALGEFLALSEPPEKADLIYVLAGDFFGNRVLVGAELAARGYANQVLLSGGPYQDTYQGDLAVRFAVEHGYPRHLFVATRLHGESTIAEAVAMGPVFERLGAKRIILVTSNYHSRRAALVFRLFLPGLHFRSVAAPDQNFAADLWWKSEHGRHLVLSEYWKMMGTLLVRAGIRPDAPSIRQGGVAPAWFEVLPSGGNGSLTLNL